MTCSHGDKEATSKDVNRRKRRETRDKQLSYDMWVFEDYVKERLKALGVLQ